MPWDLRGGRRSSACLFRRLGGPVPAASKQNAPVAAAFPAIIEGLRRTVFRRCVAPAQPIAIDEDNPRQHPPVIDPGPAPLGRFEWQIACRATHATWERSAQAEPSVRRSARKDRSSHRLCVQRLSRHASIKSMGPDPGGLGDYRTRDGSPRCQNSGPVTGAAGPVPFGLEALDRWADQTIAGQPGWGAENGVRDEWPSGLCRSDLRWAGAPAAHVRNPERQDPPHSDPGRVPRG